MDELVVRIFGTEIRGDYLLMFATVILVAIVAAIQIIVKSQSKGNSQKNIAELESLLSKPEILELIKSEKTTVTELIESTRKKQEQRTDSIVSLLGKISEDIQWDVAGVIGVGVTVVLLYMVVSGTISNAPEQIFAGWLMILGYYFGKGSKSK